MRRVQAQPRDGRSKFGAELSAGWALCGHNAGPSLDAATPACEGTLLSDSAQLTAPNGMDGRCPERVDIAANANGRDSLPGSDCDADSDGGSAEPQFKVGSSIPRAERRCIGLMCKQLLDCGRLLWLRQQRLEVCRKCASKALSSKPHFGREFSVLNLRSDVVQQAEMRHYVPTTVSGENRLLLAPVA